MPGGDRTGPAGMRPITSRGEGYCSGYSLPGGFHRPFGRGAAADHTGAGHGSGSAMAPFLRD